MFLDVGQGDAILLQRESAQVLVDGGAGMGVVRRLSEELPWFDKTIEVVISTHPDRDHLEGLLHVIERYGVKLVVLPYVSHSSQLYGEWLARLEKLRAEGNTEFRFAEAGQAITIADFSIGVLGPSQEVLAATRPSKTNNASVITRVDFPNLSFLLTGDAEAGIENALVRRLGDTPLLNVDVLKAGHHGSKTSTTQGLLDATSPSAVVISVGADNSYGHPHPDVMKRLEPFQVWRTDQNGSVEFLRHDSQWLLKTGK